MGTIRLNDSQFRCKRTAEYSVLFSRMLRLFLIFFVYALPAFALDYTLPLNDDAWSKKVFLTPEAGIRDSDAVDFELLQDAEFGEVMAVANWRAGKWNARYQYKSPLPFTTGTLTGKYRTEELLPRDAAVFISWFAGTNRVHMRTIPLQNSVSWSSFSIPLRFSYPGADAISVGIGLLSKANGRVLFSDLSFTDETAPLGGPPPIVLTRKNPPPIEKKSRFVRLAKDGATWWLVKPDGSALYSLATDGPVWEKGDIESGLLFANYLKKSGFNSLGGWSHLWRWAEINDHFMQTGENPLYVFRAVNSNQLAGGFDFLVNAQGEATGVTGHHFPDPYDPAFKLAYQEYLEGVKHLVAGKPWFVAWMPDNEIDHTDLYRYVYSPHASAAFAAFLESKYPTIAELNRHWETGYESFEALLADKPDPQLRAGVVYEDFKRFSRQLVDEYARTLSAVFKEVDPDHLLFTPRFMRSDFSNWLDYVDIYAEYFDAFAINSYPSNLMWGVSTERVAMLDEVYRRTEKAIVISEWSVPAADSGLYVGDENLDRSWNQLVKTQNERAAQAALVTAQHYNTPYVVGSHWFRWTDYDSLDRRANRGLVSVNGEYYSLLWDALASVHHLIDKALDPVAGESLTAPEDVSATIEKRTSTLEIRWIDKSDNEEGFYIERGVVNKKEKSIKYERVSEVPRDTTHFSEPLLKTSVIYYRVQAFNRSTNNVSLYSNAVKIMTKNEKNKH